MCIDCGNVRTYVKIASAFANRLSGTVFTCVRPHVLRTYVAAVLHVLGQVRVKKDVRTSTYVRAYVLHHPMVPQQSLLMYASTNVLEACAHVRTYVRMQNIRTRTYVCRYVSRLFSAFTARLQRAVISQDASGFVRTYVSKTILRK